MIISSIPQWKKVLASRHVTGAVKRQGTAHDLTSQILVVLLSLVLLAPIIPTPHGGHWIGLRVFIIQAAAFTALALLSIRILGLRVGGVGSKALSFSSPTLPLLLLIGWAALSFMFIAPHGGQGHGIAQIELLRLCTGAVVFFAAAYGCRSRFQLRLASTLLISGATVASVVAILTWLPAMQKPAIAALGDKQLLGAYLAVLLPAIVVFVLKGPASGRLWKVAGLIAVLCALLLTGTRTSWISSIIGVLAAAGLAYWSQSVRVPTRKEVAPHKHRSLSASLIMVALLSMIALFLIYVPAIHGRLSVASAQATFHARLRLWSACEQMTQARPLTGWGIGSFPLKAGAYTSEAPSAAQVKHYGVTLSSIAHNEYLQMSAEMGLVGLGLYLAVLIAFFSCGFRALKRVGFGTRRWILLASLASVFTQCVDAMSNPGWHFSEISPLLWLLMGLGMTAARPPKREEVTAKVLHTSFRISPSQRRYAQTAACAGMGIWLTTASAAVTFGVGSVGAIYAAYYYITDSSYLHFTADYITGDADGIVCDNLGGMSDDMKDKLTLSLPDFPDATNLIGTVTADGPNTNDTGDVRTIGTTTYYFPPDEFNENQVPQYVNQDITVSSVRLVTVTLHFTSQGTPHVITKPIVLARPAVVLVHGINSSPNAWNPFFDQLAGSGLGFAGAFVTVNHYDPPHYAGLDFVGADYTGWLYKGNGFVEVGADLLSKTIKTTLQAIRTGQNVTDADQMNNGEVPHSFNYSDMITIGFPSLNNPLSPLAPHSLAAKRVDVVAWSYGGVITRWYINSGSPVDNTTGNPTSQSWYKRPLKVIIHDGSDPSYPYQDVSFASLPVTYYGQDVRKVITLGSMWRGVPLANYLNEVVFSDQFSPSNGVHLGDAPVNQTANPITQYFGGLSIPSNVSGLVDFVSKKIPTRVPSMEVIAVNSPWLSQLIYRTPQPSPSTVAMPFEDTIAYGSVSGDNNQYPATQNIDPYTLLDFGTSFYDGGVPYSWFPYLGLEHKGLSFGGVNAHNFSDGLVPLWSSAIPGSSIFAPTAHSGYASDPTTFAYAIKSLNNSNLKIGSTLNGNWDTSVSSFDGNTVWPLTPGEMAPHVENDLYRQDKNGIGRINEQALKEIRSISVSSVGSTSAVISWVTATDTDSYASCQLFSFNVSYYQDFIPTKVHHASLTGLWPNTRYTYQVSSNLRYLGTSVPLRNDPNVTLTFKTNSSDKPVLSLSIGSRNSANNSFTLKFSNSGGQAKNLSIYSIKFSAAGYSLDQSAPPGTIALLGPQQSLTVKYKTGVSSSALLCRVNYQYQDVNGNPIIGVSSWLRIK